MRRPRGRTPADRPSYPGSKSDSDRSCAGPDLGAAVEPVGPPVYGTVSKATPARGMLPNLIIIGAPKAGTTSLHRYLDLHPDVAMTTEKELRYFWRADWRDRLPWYEAQFEFEGKPRGRGGAPPAYPAYPRRDNAPRRMHELVPEVKLIYLVRDPIERLVSHWAQ